MKAATHEITRDDILPMADYARERKGRRRALTEVKQHRRLEVGPVCSFYFENYETMWNQVHEMLFIEKGGEAQIADQLSAYNPLIPKGRELVATVMLEIDDPVRRGALLAKLGGVEETASSGSAARPSTASPRPTWTAPAPPARPPRCSSSTSPSPTPRSRRSAVRGGPEAEAPRAPRWWSASPTPSTPT